MLLVLTALGARTCTPGLAWQHGVFSTGVIFCCIRVEVSEITDVCLPRSKTQTFGVTSALSLSRPQPKVSKRERERERDMR